MSVIYRPTTIAGYYDTLKRVQRIAAEYEAIKDPEEAIRFHQQHWEDLKAVVEPPAINMLILDEFMGSYERFTAHLAKALLEFDNIPEELQYRHPPGNAATLWRSICEGIDRVADALTKPPEK